MSTETKPAQNELVSELVSLTQDSQAPSTSGKAELNQDTEMDVIKSDKKVEFEKSQSSRSPQRPSTSGNHKSKQSMSTPSSSDESRHTARGNKRQKRPYDVIIFAASSSVGRFLVEEMALVIDKHFSNSGNQSSGQDQFAQQATSRRPSVPSSKINSDIRWAVAGRSAIRLSEALCRAELSTGIKNLSASVPVILADLNHQRSLLEMCDKADIVINCAGPYSDLGAEILIKACVESGTNYIDLAHESTFVEMINQRYSEQARRRGIYILNGCGFQSMSAEMGLNFTKQVVDGRIEQVKIILSLSDTKSVSRLSSRTSGIVSEGMWNSLLTEKAQEVTVDERMKLRSLSYGRELIRQATSHKERGSRNHKTDHRHQDGDDDTDQDDGNRALLSAQTKENKTKKLLERKDTQSLVKDIIQFRNRNVPTLAWPLQIFRQFQSQRGRGYCWPVDNLTGDESQLIRGEMNNYSLRRPDFESSDGWRPIRCTTFVSVKHFTHLCLLFVWIFIFELVVKFSLARYVMRKLPGLASVGHVANSSGSSLSRWFFNGDSGNHVMSGRQQQQLDRDSLNHIKYCQTFIAYGRPSDNSGDPLEDRQRNNSNHSHVQLLVARVVGPEPNHVATATFVIQAAVTLIMEREHLPGTGGVLTPGAAFSETNIIYQLRRRNIKFEVLKKA